MVAATLARASRKYNLTTTLTAHEPSTYNIPAVVLHGSVLQNEILHSSEGLTLLSLDHLYTFKSALSHYTAIRTEAGGHFALEDAVDELRRYVLSSAAGRRRLLKSTLVQAFDWLGPVNDIALAEVTVMYTRAYGAATDTGVADDLMHAASSAPAGTTMEVSSNVAEEAVALRTDESTPRPPPRSAARLTQASLDPVAPTSSVATPAHQTSVGGESRVCSPALSLSHGSRPPVPAESLVVDTESLQADKRMIISVDTPPVETPARSSAAKEVVAATAVEERDMGQEENDEGDKTPVPSNTANQKPSTSAQTPQTTPQTCPSPPVSPHHRPFPKTTPRPSAPTLKLQTTFPSIRKPITKRKKTPTPSSSKRRSCTPTNAVPIFLSATTTTPPSLNTDGDICIELAPSSAAADDNDNDNDNDAASVQTDFEDADLTARSPAVAKTPGGSIWLGIDDILLSAGPSRGFHSRWRRSSELLLQTPAGEKMGPMTPNGYEDISPVTRGEWGFLMVGESFRTRTAGVSCV
ncbi:unnamed protein product [Discula destructiva]